MGCMCVPPRKRVGGVGEFVFTFDDFASKVPGLPRSRRARGDFERLLDWLVENNVPPCRSEGVRRFHVGLSLAGTIAWPLSRSQAASPDVGVVENSALSECGVGGAVRGEGERGTGRCGAR